MSITPAEIESQINAIKWSTGKVYIGGLGMGYILNQIKDKPEVSSVLVVEINPDVIQIYKGLFGDHPKVTIVRGDVFSHDPKQEFDYAYFDIWPDGDIDLIEEDMQTLQEVVKAKYRSFWGIERWISEYHYCYRSPSKLTKKLGISNRMLLDCINLFEDLVNEEQEG